MGLFHPFLADESVKLLGVEAGGRGINPGNMQQDFRGKLGVLQGTKTWLLSDDDGQIELTHSVSAGLDYAAVGPEHANLKDVGRAEYTFATDDEALEAFQEVSKEGIIPALETAHGLAGRQLAKLGKDGLIICNCSGRGDCDVAQAAKAIFEKTFLVDQI